MNKRQAKKRARQRAEKSKSLASEYFSTGAEVQSAVNRINNRIRTVVDHFGKDSRMAQDLFTLVDTYVPINFQYYNKDDILQISKPYQIYKDPDLHATINALDNRVPTYSDIKVEYSKSYESFKQSAPEWDIGIDNYIDVFSQVMDALNWAYDNQDTDEGRQIIEIMSRSHKSYQDLVTVVSFFQQGKENE